MTRSRPPGGRPPGPTRQQPGRNAFDGAAHRGDLAAARQRRSRAGRRRRRHRLPPRPTRCSAERPRRRRREQADAGVEIEDRAANRHARRSRARPGRRAGGGCPGRTTARAAAASASVRRSSASRSHTGCRTRRTADPRPVRPSVPARRSSVEASIAAAASRNTTRSEASMFSDSSISRTASRPSDRIAAISRSSASEVAGSSWRVARASQTSWLFSRKEPEPMAAHVQPRAHPIARPRESRRRPPAPAACTRPMRLNASAITSPLISSCRG